MTALAHVPIVLSLLLLGAHFMRDGAIVITGLIASLCVLLSVRRAWAARVLQTALLLGCVEWIRTLIVLGLQRQHAGLPWMRMALILGAVAALAALSAWLFQTRHLSERFQLGGR